MQVQTFSRIEDVYEALQKNKADAVVFDAPVLLYYTAHEGQGKAEIIGPVFQKESYGIALTTSSPWRRPVNLALLTLKENGTYDAIYNKWFGNKEAGSP